LNSSLAREGGLGSIGRASGESAHLDAAIHPLIDGIDGEAAKINFGASRDFRCMTSTALALRVCFSVLGPVEIHREFRMAAPA